VRSSLILLMHRKLLRKRSVVSLSVNVGSLTSTDVDRICDSTESFHFLWMTPMLLFVSLGILASTLGFLPMLAGFATLIVVMSCTALSNTKFKTIKKIITQKTDQRVSRTVDLTKNLESIKSLALESDFKNEILVARNEEVHFIRKYFFVFAFFRSFAVLLSPLILLSTISMCIYLDTIELTPINVFVALAAVNGLTMPFQSAVDVAVSLAELVVAMRRITTLLSCDEVETTQSLSADESASGIMLKFDRSSFTYDHVEAQKIGKARAERRDSRAEGLEEGFHSDEDNEEEVSLVVHSNQEENEPQPNLALLSINLHAGLGEIVWICGRVGSGKSSLLLAALGELPAAEGAVRSSDSVLYLGQVPAVVSGSIIENITFGLDYNEEIFKRASEFCALMPDFEALVDGAETVVGERGVNLSGGQKTRVCLARVLYRVFSLPAQNHLLLLDDPLSAVDVQTGHQLLVALRSVLKNCSVLLCSHHTHLIQPNEKVVLLDQGRVVAQGTLTQIAKVEVVGSDLIQLFYEPNEEVEPESAHEHEHEHEPALEAQSSERAGPMRNEKKKSEFHTAEARKKGRVAVSVYRSFFFTSKAGWSGVLLMYMITFCVQLSLQFYLTELAAGRGDLKGYTSLAAAFAACTVFRVLALAVQTIRASSALHNMFLSTVCRLTKKSLDTTPSGFFVSRATSDFDKIDNKLAPCINIFLQRFFDLTQIAIIGSVSTMGIFSVAAITVAVLAMMIGRYFALSSVELARSLSISKAPVQTGLLETSNSLLYIRSFEQSEKWREIIKERVWTNVSIAVHSMAANRWLSLRLSLLGTLAVWSLSYLAILLPDKAVAFVALGLSYSLEFRGILNMFIRNSVELENAMLAAERIRHMPETLELEPEGGEKFNADRASIRFENVGAVYRPGLPPALVDVSFELRGGEKLGVCGRTGSGKTTLLRVLLRLVPHSGEIFIDRQEINDVELSGLRAMLPTVTQTSLMFRGSIRDTVDPTRRLQDEQVRSLMDRVGLQHLDMALPSSTLSVGELQLASISRTIAAVECFGAKVLLLDEASSSIDKISQSTISNLLGQQSLAHITSIIVAHRISTILSCDKILVMHEGKAIEFGSPKELNQPGTRFHELVTQNTDAFTSE
jgi:ABC-type multidrug transport system fused ATPase/permease subunit